VVRGENGEKKRMSSQKNSAHYEKKNGTLKNAKRRERKNVLTLYPRKKKGVAGAGVEK